MAYELDTERLRRDLEDDYGTAMSSGFPMAMMEMSEVERASDRELIEMAREKRMDLSNLSFNSFSTKNYTNNKFSA